MSRDALVVGINKYSYKGLGELTAPAQDAEAIAKLLENYGEFKVTRLPAVKDKENETIRVGLQSRVSLPQLKKAIIQLFKPQSNPPNTALLYFSGHGLREEQGVEEGFLATSEVNPDAGNWGLSLQWLRRLLQESEVKQQIIILDCCYSGEVVNFAEADPGERGKGRDRCFIAASRDYEVAYQDINSPNSVLTAAILKGLEPKQERWVSNYTLVELLNQGHNSFPQRFIFANSGEVINLTRRWNSSPANFTVQKSTLCPYKGLAYFDCTEEDAKFFYGRTALTDELLEKVRSGNFLAVLGASGSGKSSAVRAGLLYQLKLGYRLSDSDTWQFKDFRPGVNPLRSLALAFVESGLSDIEKGLQLAKAEELITKGAVGLRQLITAIQKPVLLVIDQFEEAFTLCCNSQERHQFFDCLLGALEYSGNELRLVIAMRADFLGKCAEYSDLAQRIQNHQVIVRPMFPDELREAITKPAQQVDLEIEPELVNQMIADVAESPGILPLLQYTLSILWEQRTSDNRLTVQAYTNLGGIRRALPKRADEIYSQYSVVEKEVTRKIFLKLTQLGEGTEDTRRQVRKQDLLNSHSHPEVVEQIIQKLTDQQDRLLVTSVMLEKGDSSKQVEVVDVAHEALIRHWDLLRKWLDENRELIRLERKIEGEAKEWVENDRAEEYLLRGKKLRQAEDFLESLQQQHDGILFDQNAQEFVQQSVQKEKEEQEIKRRIEQDIIEKEKEEQERKKQEIQEQLKKEQEKLRKQKQRLLKNRIVLGITIPILFGAFAWIWNSKQNAGIVRLAQDSNRLSDSNKEADALLEGIKAAKALKNSFVVISPNTRTQVTAALGRAIYDLKEMNSLEGHRSAIKNLSFSPDANTLASVDDDGVIKLWKSDGILQKTIHGHTRYIHGVSFSPNGKMFASASGDGTVKLWNLEDYKLIQTFLGHSKAVNKVIFSPDGKNLISASDDRSIKVWPLDGKLPIIIKVDSPVKDITFSPDGNVLASSETNGGRDKLKDGTVDNSKDGIIKLWDWNSADKKTIRAIRTEQCNNNKCTIWAVRFSPDGKFLATASENRTIKLWNSDGDFVGYIDGSDKNDGGHQSWILGLNFSSKKTQDGKYLLASASDDKSVRLWSFRPDYDVNSPKKKELTLEVLELAGHKSKVSAVEFTSDGRTLASASNDKTVKLWNIDSRLQELKHEKEKVKSVSFSPDGKTLASSGQSETNNKGIIHLWDWNKKSKRWKNKQSISAHDLLIKQVRFSPDGQKLASASWDGTIKLWNKEGELLASSPKSKHNYNSVSFSHDGRWIASDGANNNVIIWKYAGNSLTQRQVLSKHTNKVLSVSFSPDGKWLASADIDNIIKIWRGEDDSWKLQKDLKGHRDSITAVTFSLDGQLLASASDDYTVKLWNLNGKLINTLYDHTGNVTNIAFSPDSQILASVGVDKKVILWDRNGNLLHTINKHNNVISGVQFSPDGQTLASASDDRRVILWSLNPDQLLEEGCVLSSNYLRTNPYITSENRSLCSIPKLEPELLVEQGRDLARQGKIEAALAKFKEAQQRGKTLDFEPNKEAEDLAKFSKQLKIGLEAALQGNIQEAASAFEIAIKLNPDLANSGIDPKKEAERLYRVK